jgi:CBS domain-containing protein
MRKSSRYETDAVSVTADASCVEVADLMDLKSVGCVVVVEDERPIGMITDRDLLCRVIAADLDPDKTTAADVMTRDPVWGQRDDDIHSLLKVMREGSIRRLPLVEDGRLVGLLSLDDLLIQLGSYLFNANRGILGGLDESRRTSRHRRRTEAREEALESIRHQLVAFGDETRDKVRGRLEEMLDRVSGGR